MQESPVVSRKSELLVTEVDGELVGLHIENGTCYGFNATATQIWLLLEEPKTLSALCDGLMERFDVDRATCEREALALVRDLERDGLVEFDGIKPDA